MQQGSCGGLFYWGKGTGKGGGEKEDWPLGAGPYPEHWRVHLARRQASIMPKC